MPTLQVVALYPFLLGAVAKVLNVVQVRIIALKKDIAKTIQQNVRKQINAAVRKLVLAHAALTIGNVASILTQVTLLM